MLRHARGEIAGPQPAEQRDGREHRVVGRGVLDGEADPDGRQQQHRRAPHGEVAAAEDRHGERIQRAEDGAGEPRQRRQPEQLIRREREPDARQLDHDHAPHHPNREGEQQRGHRQPQVAVGDAPAGGRPEGLVVRPPVDEHVTAPARGLDQLGARQRGARRGVLLENALALVALRDPRPDHGDDDHEGHQHEAAAAHADHVGGDAEHDRQREAAQAADDADDAADHAHLGRVVVGEAAVDARLAEALRQADDEDQHGEQGDAHADLDGDVALDRVDDHRRGRVAQQEHAGEADPHHPPGDRVPAPLVGRPAAQRADRPGRQVEQNGQERRGGERQPVLADVVLGQPQRQRHEGAEHEVVGEAEAPDAHVEQRLQLLAQRDARAGSGVLAVQRVLGGQEPEQDRHHQHGDGVDLRHRAPRAGGGGGDDQRGDELGERRPRIAGAEDAHRRALPLLAEPGRGIGDAHRERAAGDPDEQPEHQVLPVLGGVGQHPGGDHDSEHLYEIHDAPAVTVGQYAQRQPYQRAGQDGSGHQQAELGLVEVELRLDLDADDREHHPHGEVHGEGERAHRQRRDLLAADSGLDCGGRRHFASPQVMRTRAPTSASFDPRARGSPNDVTLETVEPRTSIPTARGFALTDIRAARVRTATSPPARRT